MKTLVNASVTFATSVDAPLETVKAAINDPAWSKWIPFLKADQCEGDTAGSKRVCTMVSEDPQMDGYELQETIEENDKDAGRLAYSIQNPPLPVQNLRGTVEATQNEQGQVIVSWTSSFDAEEDIIADARPMMIMMYQGALAGLGTYTRKQVEVA